MQSEGQAGAGLVVAVDGPSSSGKSSTARGVAERLRLRYLDTGAMYRALTWWMLEQHVDVHDAEAVARTCGEPTLVSGTDPGAPTIQVDGTDVSGPIRGPAVTAAVSAVSAVPAVRDRMVGLQRQIIGAGRIVVEGRDIGSVVAPGAQLKVFLTADPDTRAHRRTAELVGGNTSVHDTAADLDRRDRLDSVRAASPLVRAEDALVLDTTHLSLAEAVDAVAELARSALGEAQWEQPR